MANLFFNSCPSTSKLRREADAVARMISLNKREVFWDILNFKWRKSYAKVKKHKKEIKHKTK